MLEMQVVGKQFIGKPGSLAKEVVPAQRLFCLLVGNHHRFATQIGPEIVVMGIAALKPTRPATSYKNAATTKP